MIEYITRTDADGLESGWSGSSTQEAIDKALLQANTWLSALQLVDFTEIPLQIKYAGVELAKLSLANKLFESVEKVSSKTVSAGGGVSVSKSYEGGFTNESRDMNYIRALVQPYLTNQAHFYISRG